MPLVDSIPALRVELGRVADADKAPQMARYMKDHFAFLGVTTPDRRRAMRPFIDESRHSDPNELLEAADALWDEPEREFQYVATDLLRRRVGALRQSDLGRVERFIRTKSWWDTVDALAAHVVGSMVGRYPELVAAMDRWIDDEDIWIARTAILHQLTYEHRVDAGRLFGYVDRRSADTEFFIRKACGWALRQHARVDPDAVRDFVTSRGDRLSGLTRREATKHL